MNDTTLLATAQVRQLGASRCYSVYGLCVRTPIALSVSEVASDTPCDVDVLAGDPALFEESLRNVTLNREWAQAHRLPARWVYARIEGVVDFLINPDGSQVFFRQLADLSATFETSFEAYLLGLLMKAVLIKKNIPSLHASAIVADGRAIAFLGSNGFGKSSLASYFVDAGYRLLTDDVLRLGERDGRVWAYPGPASLKLLPDSGRGSDGSIAAVPMDPGADKCLYPVAADLRCDRPVPLAALYCLPGPADAKAVKRISVETLGAHEALPEVLYGIDRDRIVEPDRATNPFDAARLIVKTVPVRRVSYPWELGLFPNVREAILGDLRNPGGES